MVSYIIYPKNIQFISFSESFNQEHWVSFTNNFTSSQANISAK